MTRPAELASFNVAHSDDAIIHEVAIMHEPHPRDTLKDLTLAGHVITITKFHVINHIPQDNIISKVKNPFPND